MSEREEPRGIELTRAQLEAWAGRSLTDGQVEMLDDAIPNSSIPESVATICDQLGDGDE
jgi:hypothetical protein